MGGGRREAAKKLFTVGNVTTFNKGVNKQQNRPAALLSLVQLIPRGFLLLSPLPLSLPVLQAKDDRSDVESSSDEETSTLQSRTSQSSATVNGTNGTNGYLTGSNSAEEY